MQHPTLALVPVRSSWLLNTPRVPPWRVLLLTLAANLWLLPPPCAAQIEISSAGDVAFGSQAPVAGYRLRILGGPNNGTALWAYTNSGTYRYGIHAIATGTGGNTSYGVRGLAEGASSSNIGLRGLADGGNNAYGLFASATGGVNNTYAGYFDGNVYVTGMLTEAGSDLRMKENIAPLSERGILEKLLALRPTSFRFKREGEYAVMHLPEGERYGLIAQEVEEVLPELVVAGFHPGPVDEAGHFVDEPLTFKNVDYRSLIPFLIQALQEQQAEIEGLKATLEANGIAIGN